MKNSVKIYQIKGKHCEYPKDVNINETKNYEGV